MHNIFNRHVCTMLKRMMKIALGSEVDKSYIVEEKPVATGGPHFCWRVYLLFVNFDLIGS